MKERKAKTPNPYVGGLFPFAEKRCDPFSCLAK